MQSRTARAPPDAAAPPLSDAGRRARGWRNDWDTHQQASERRQQHGVHQRVGLVPAGRASCIRHRRHRRRVPGPRRLTTRCALGDKRWLPAGGGQRGVEAMAVGRQRRGGDGGRGGGMELEGLAGGHPAGELLHDDLAAPVLPARVLA
jgi:hypothetical protein